MDDDERNWSVVMTEFSGEWWDLVEATREAFGREGFDASGPAVYPERCLPAEIADGLTQQEAEAAAEQFRAHSATMVVTKSDELPEVKLRATQYWSQKSIGDLCFTEIDGRVTTTLNLARARQLMYVDMEAEAPWRQEAFINHDDIYSSPPSEQDIPNGRKLVAELASALQQAYPDRGFTISHWLGELVTFWQTSPDSLREAEDGQELTFVGPTH